jgi:signal recognition particle receptor subunit beta
MVFFNYSTMQMAAKVVYYGPGLCGKTTNLQYIYSRTSKESRGEMVSLETETDRTLFFDLLPIDVGSIAGFATRIQLYTVPGQVFYNTTRKLVLKGVDGVVFVADSQRPMLQANIDSFRNLEENLQEMGLSMETVPVVLQFNKRDLHDIASVEELNQALNRGNWPSFEASALTGTGVFETLKGVSKLTLLSLKKRLSKDSPRAGAATRPAATTTRPAPAPQPEPASVGAAAGRGGASGVHAPAAAPSAQVAASAPAPVVPHAPPAAKPGRPAAAASVATAPRPAPPKPKTQSDVLAELEKIRRQALRPGVAPAVAPAAMPPVASAAPVHVPAAVPTTATAVPTLPPAAAAAAVNGKHEINREIQLTLKRGDFERAKRFLLTLQVEDGQHQVMEAVRDFQVDIGGVPHHQKVVLRLNIALRTKE